MGMKEHGISFSFLFFMNCKFIAIPHCDLPLYLSILPKGESAYRDLLGIVSYQILPFLYFPNKFFVTLHLINCNCFLAVDRCPWSVLGACKV